MLRLLRTHLSYANMMATIAVFIALGGGAYAAIKLPRNSVGTAQLKKNAVVSSKVRNGSLLSKDFKAGQLPRGPGGPQGAQGAQGAQGPKGDLGPTEGGSGDSISSVTRQATIDATDFTTQHAGRLLVSKTISDISENCSAGTWAVWLDVDGTRVPGTYVGSLGSGTHVKPLGLTGVTAGVLPAGPHTASFAVQCGGTVTGSSSIAAHDISYVVLGNG